MLMKILTTALAAEGGVTDCDVHDFMTNRALALYRLTLLLQTSFEAWRRGTYKVFVNSERLLAVGDLEIYDFVPKTRLS